MENENSQRVTELEAKLKQEESAREELESKYRGAVKDAEVNVGEREKQISKLERQVGTKEGLGEFYGLVMGEKEC